MAKKITESVPCLTAKQLLDALTHSMTDRDPVILKKSGSAKMPTLLIIKKIEAKRDTTFEISGEVCLPKGWVYMTGIFKGNPWKTLKGKITYEEK